jgi:methylation protein EvaC
MKCKVSGQKIKPFMSFGKMPMANGFLDKKNFKKEFFYKLDVGFCKKNYLFQVNDHPKSPHIFNNNYPFYTNKSIYMVRHFKNYFKWVKKNFLSRESKIIEIGSNDGSFLKNFKKNNFDHIGFEPSKNVADYSKKNYQVNVFNGFFNTNNIKKFKKFKLNTDLICAANVICHIPNLKEVIKSIDYLLSKKGVFVFEEPYLGSMFKKNSYDQIYDAHVFIFSLHSVRSIFKSFGFDLINAIPQKTHGGSMRYVIARSNQRTIKSSVKRLISEEKKLKLDKIETCFKFKKLCKLSKKNFIKKLKYYKAKGKKIAGYAASAKSTTVFNYCDLGPNIVDYITDSTKEKIGKFSPGKHIPIVSINHFRKYPPDIAILCSWNHKNEIIKKEKNFKRFGGKWISHVKV